MTIDEFAVILRKSEDKSGRGELLSHKSRD
jgi:hypothetical protein